MGEMVMKQEDIISRNLTNKGNIQFWIIVFAIVVMFIFSSFTFFNALYVICDVLGSVVCKSSDVALKDLIRSLPIILPFVMTFFGLLMFHTIYRNDDEKRRNKTILKYAILMTAFSGFNILYVIIGRISGVYLSFVEGSPSPIYPLDSIFYSLLFLVLGILAIIFCKKNLTNYVFESGNRGPIVSRKRGLYYFGFFAWLIASVFGFSSFFIGLFIVDFEHGHLAYSIILLLIYIVSPIILCFYEFIYSNLVVEKRKQYAFLFGLISIVITSILMVLYFVFLSLDLDAPSNIGFGAIPVAFTASVNVGTLVMVIIPFSVSLTCLIKGIIYKRNKN